MRLGNFNCKRLILPAAFVCFLILTIYLHQQQGNQVREEGKKVQVKVIDVKSNSGARSGSLDVTVSYQGKSYKLHGVSSSEHFIMNNSIAYHWKIDATLYGNKMYYGSTGPMSILDILYLASLGITFVMFCLNFLQLKDELWK
ncbi:MAG: hypothetical protein K1W30_11140 [Lachnospiraceae bacterium]